MCLVTQLCLTLCNPMAVACQASLSMGILQARILEWAAMPSSRGSFKPRDGTQVSSALHVNSLTEPPGKPNMQYND